jgi:hypothetical protein
MTLSLAGPRAPASGIASLLTIATLLVGACGSAEENRFTESTGLLTEDSTLTAPVLTSPASLPPLCGAGEAGVVSDATDEPVAQPTPWVWPAVQDGLTRCTQTSDRKEFRAWPFEPLSRTGGLEITGTWKTTSQGLVVDDIAVRNVRPTDARLRTLRVVARDPSGEVAHGLTDIAGVTDAEMARGLVIPGADPDGTTHPVAIPDPLDLPYTSERRIDPAAITLTFEVESYDVMYRVAAASEAERYADVDDVRAVPVGDELATRQEPVRLGSVPGGEVCLTDRGFDSYQEAVLALSLPRPTPRRPVRLIEDEPVFIATIELLHWPDWDEIHKSAAVVAEEPLDPIPDDWPVLSEEATDALADAWELCATDLVGRVVAVSRLPEYLPAD